MIFFNFSFIILSFLGLILKFINHAINIIIDKKLAIFDKIILIDLMLGVMKCLMKKILEVKKRKI